MMERDDDAMKLLPDELEAAMDEVKVFSVTYCNMMGDEIFNRTTYKCFKDLCLPFTADSKVDLFSNARTWLSNLKQHDEFVKREEPFAACGNGELFHAEGFSAVSDPPMDFSKFDQAMSKWEQWQTKIRPVARDKLATAILRFIELRTRCQRTARPWRHHTRVSRKLWKCWSSTPRQSGPHRRTSCCSCLPGRPRQ